MKIENYTKTLFRRKRDKSLLYPCDERPHSNQTEVMCYYLLFPRSCIRIHVHQERDLVSLGNVWISPQDVQGDEGSPRIGG